MKLIRMIVAVVALSMVLGAAATSASAAGSITKQAKKKCKKKHGKAKKKCINKEKKRLKKQRKNKPPVTIRTTEGGVPRIIAGNFRGLGYGYGFALAKENICSMAQIYTTVRGDRSKYFGPDEEWMLTGNGIPYTNLESDFAHRRIINNGSLDRILSEDPPNGPSPEIKNVVAGYVKGYNRYLERKGVDNLPDETCKGEPWVKKIDKQQVYLRFFELGTMAGLGVAVDGIANVAPPGAAASSGKPEPVPLNGKPTAADFESFDQNLPDIGSNAVALGSETTDSGKGMLFGNPHFPWIGSERFFQSQLIIPGKFNVSGASLLGSPAINIGHTQKLAWSHTVSTARRFSMYREELVPGDPTSYLVDGQPVKMDSTEVTVPVLQDDGTLKNETRTLYETKHGPITNSVQKQELFPWTDNYAYALTDPNSEGLRFIEHFFEANQAQSVNDLKKVLNQVQGVPWVNTIAADSKGKALYADRGVIPNLTDERVAECNTPGLGTVAWTTSRVAVLDGSTSSCDMQKAPGAVVAGVLGPDQMPLQIRNDYESNMNDSYWLSNPNAPITGYPSIIGNEETGRSLWTRNGLSQIEERLNGTDGQSGNKYTFPQMRKFTTNNRHYGAELLIPPLVTYCMANPTIDGVDVSAACNALAGWGLTEKLDDPGSYLGRRVIGRLLSVPGGPWTAPFSLGDPVHTPNGLDTTKPEVGLALSDTVTEMQGYGIPFDASWRDYQYVTRNGEKIPIPGGSGGQGVFNVISSVRNPATGVYDDVRHGSSFIIQASLTGKKCPSVKTILTYSQAATNAKSKHYADQTRLFSDSKWLTDRFCNSQQKKDPELKVTKLNGGSNAVNKGGW
ncbi:MAG: penicillin acylase family protein [Solirubrobacterales bacterium]|nr:penicillin acylase family protein [Solirubrobacterales bacterium]